jgi:hypothetical protein
LEVHLTTVTRSWGTSNMTRTSSSARSGESTERASGRRRRSLRIRLDPEHHALLHDLAADVDVTADQLASIWLRDRLDLAAGARSLALLGERRRDLVEDRRDAGGGARVPHAETSRRTSLHTAIVEVLEDHGGPMTAAQIADAIRIRGAYRSPRSGQPITGATVSRRVANPYYRDLFERDGRRLDLAGRSRQDREGR